MKRMTIPSTIHEGLTKADKSPVLHGHPGCTVPWLGTMPNECRFGENNPHKDKRRRNEKETMDLSVHTKQRRRKHRASGGAGRIKTQSMSVSEGQWGWEPPAMPESGPQGDPVGLLLGLQSQKQLAWACTFLKKDGPSFSHYLNLT